MSRGRSHLPVKAASTGAAALEFMLVLPVLLMLALPVFDFARVIQANTILINISREGANLASRASLEYSNQTIMGAIASTAPPLDMGAKGMIYITKVMGNKENCGGGTCPIRNIVVAQYRWAQGWSQSGYSPNSAVWNCSRWAGDGSCSGIPAPGPTSPTANVMTGQLADGEVIHVVEAFYRFTPLFGGINLGPGLTTPQPNRELYAMTIF